MPDSSKMEEAPAEPILAANIWLSTSREDKFNDGAERIKSSLTTADRKISTGCKSIDDALAGGLDHGVVHCIVAEPDEDTRELLQALLVSHVRSSPDATATLIESTSSFDIRRLFQLLEKLVGTDEDETALQILERLKIMRVFDYVGLTEAVSELRGGGVDDNVALPGGVEVDEKAGRLLPKSTIEDSEDEDEMLDSMAPLSDGAAIADPIPKQGQSGGLLIIDNISQVMAPLIKNNYTHGQACLSSFMRSVTQLTRAYDFCTVLVSHASNKPAIADEEALSLFTSCTVRPALGLGFGFLVDVLMYLHSVPRKERKAARAGIQGRNANMVSVLEVVHDKHGGRHGRWAPFVCDPDGRPCEIS